MSRIRFGWTLLLGIVVSTLGMRSVSAQIASEPLVTDVVSLVSEAEWDELGDVYQQEDADDSCCCEPETLFTPNMLGHSLGLPKVFRPIGGGPLVFIHRHFSHVADNNSPLPRDRVYYGMQYFSNAPLVRTLGMGDLDLDIHTHRIGIEKTFLKGRASAEFLVPFQYTTSSNITGLGFTQSGLADVELGQIAFGFKYLLRRTENSALSLGLRIETPTDENIGTGPILYNTNAVHLTPYIGYVRTRNDWFLQGFVSHRSHTNEMPRFIAGGGAGTVRDPNVFSVDAAIGRWFRWNRSSCLTAIAPTLELHYRTQTEGEAQRLFNSAIYGANVDNLNLTMGLTALFGENVTTSVALVTPLRSNVHVPAAGPIAGLSHDTDRFFDAELMFQVNIFYGRK